MIAVPNPAMYEQDARHVLRLRMRLPDSALRLRVESMVEEALRLTTLPGEDQGRIYFFRQLELPIFDVRSSPQQWVARCSQQLLAISHTAHYAGDHGSAFAPAVYFHDQHEPRRLLLARLLADETPREWYWQKATGVACDLPAPLRVEQVLELWHVQPAAWAAVARELLPLLSAQATRTLLQLLRSGTAERWLGAMESARTQIPHQTQPPVLRPPTLRLLRDLCLHFPENDPRVVFFSVLAVLESCPSVTQNGTLVTMAESLSQQPAASVAPERDARGRLLLRPKITTGPTPEHVKDEAEAANIFADRATTRNKTETANLSLPDVAMRGEHRTGFAGLYFLLHPLRHLGIAEVLEANPQLALTHFVSRILLRLALTAAVEEDDPILLPLLEDLAEQTQQPADPLIIPSTLASLRRLHASEQLTERLWAVAIRRWCRTYAHMSLRQMIARPGRIYATPTDIEVTMPMSAVELRIRRCGLDLDPGYVPWFGRVIHFHYHIEAQP